MYEMFYYVYLIYVNGRVFWMSGDTASLGSHVKKGDIGVQVEID